MSTMFRVVDRPEAKSTTYGGVTYMGNPDRDVVEEFGYIEPLDAITDEFVSVPIRSVLHFGGPTFEFGTFDLADQECVALFNALGRHLQNFRIAKFVEAGDPA